MSSAGRPIHTSKSRKKILQRLYRSTEADDFSQLRQIIKELTQENPHTRHDVLMKAAEIIRQLDREYRYLLTLEQTVPASTVASSASSPMQYPVLHPEMPHSPPANWSMNYASDYQMMPMDPSLHMPSSSHYPPPNLNDATYSFAHNNGY